MSADLAKGRTASPIGFAPGTRLPVPARVAQDALESIATANHGRLLPAAVVEAATPERHPLHRCFTWDDTIAAQMHREEQARRLIRSVVVREVAGEALDEPVRAYINGRTADSSDYRSVVQVLADDELADKLLSRALDEARSWRRRYRSLERMRDICQAIDRVLDEVAV